MDLSLGAVITGVLGGSLTYLFLLWLYGSVLPDNEIELPKSAKRWGAYVIAFAMGGVALYLGNLWGYVEVDREVIWQAMVQAFISAFAISQLIHTGELAWRESDPANRAQ